MLKGSKLLSNLWCLYLHVCQVQSVFIHFFVLHSYPSVLYYFHESWCVAMSLPEQEKIAPCACHVCTDVSLNAAFLLCFADNFCSRKKCCPLQPLQQWGLSSRVCMTKTSSVGLSAFSYFCPFVFLESRRWNSGFVVYLLFRKIDNIYSCYHMIIGRLGSAKSSKKFPCQKRSISLNAIISHCYLCTGVYTSMSAALF